MYVLYYWSSCTIQCHFYQVSFFKNINWILNLNIQSKSFCLCFFLNFRILKRWLTKMANWANCYMDQRVKTSHWSSVNVQKNGPFYAVCQTIFYVFAFRNIDLVGSRKCKQVFFGVCEHINLSFFTIGILTFFRRCLYWNFEPWETGYL
jgi:hypothetical protein